MINQLQLLAVVIIIIIIVVVVAVAVVVSLSLFFVCYSSGTAESQRKAVVDESFCSWDIFRG